jgi:hypothetical protein
MTPTNANLIWKIADLLRGPMSEGKKQQWQAIVSRRRSPVARGCPG